VTTRGLSLERIAQAAGVIGAPFRDSPQFECEPLGDRPEPGLIAGNTR
jgi:hypothetical protein